MQCIEPESFSTVQTVFVNYPGILSIFIDYQRNVDEIQNDLILLIFFPATIMMRVLIFPLAVKARKLTIISINHAPEMSKFQDEILTSTTPEESK